MNFRCHCCGAGWDCCSCSCEDPKALRDRIEQNTVEAIVAFIDKQRARLTKNSPVAERELHHLRDALDLGTWRGKGASQQASVDDPEKRGPNG